MGIPGLHKYLSTLSSGEVPVNFRASSDGTIKTLVVDGYGSLRKLYPSNLEWIHSGDWISLERNTKNFVNIFKLNGFKLVFMFDGNISKKRRSTWIARKKKRP